MPQIKECHRDAPDPILTIFLPPCSEKTPSAVLAQPGRSPQRAYLAHVREAVDADPELPSDVNEARIHHRDGEEPLLEECKEHREPLSGRARRQPAQRNQCQVP